MFIHWSKAKNILCIQSYTDMNIKNLCAYGEKYKLDSEDIGGTKCNMNNGTR